ncbi:hypothetical protein [Achromobacter spanius]|uniref:hypothetical protein n=1 Tax=Achromobacter spanius TaxID=217203 RepID=UPI00167688B2|nr:hypothetical protein [Achromobacter spanius]
MRNAAPMSFGARLASRRFKREEIACVFSVPSELVADVDPQPAEPAEPEAKTQIGPLDV